MQRHVVLVAILFVVVGLSFSPAATAELLPTQQSTAQPVQIISVSAGDTVPYNETLDVRILVSHDQYSFPEVCVFYMPIIDNRTLGTFWRVSPAQLLQTYLNETLYIASVPNKAFGEALPSGTIIVYYVEARDPSGSALTTRQEDRWNPFIVDDKFVLQVIDVTPPSISQVAILSDQPVSGQAVAVSVEVTDGQLGSGIRTVTLSYSVDGGAFTNVQMTLFEENTYATSIPAEEHDQKVTFFVTASDKAGNKATSNSTSYVVQKSVEEIAAEQKASQLTTLTVGFILGVIILGTVFLKRRTFVGLVKSPQAAFTIGMLLVFVVAARVAFVLWQNWSLWWWDAIILMALVEFWALVDPRIQGTVRPFMRATLEFGRSLTIRLSKTFQENPPTILVAGAYVLGIGGVVSDVILYLATRNLSVVYVLANFIAEYVFILIVMGVIGQVILLWRKGTSRAAKPATNA